jgi:hypothetical protein
VGIYADPLPIPGQGGERPEHGRALMDLKEPPPTGAMNGFL